MSNPHDSLHGLEVEIEVELAIAESGHEDVVDTPPSEWLSDPVDEERYEVGLHGLFDAVKAVEDATLRTPDEGIRERADRRQAVALAVAGRGSRCGRAPAEVESQNGTRDMSGSSGQCGHPRKSSIHRAAGVEPAQRQNCGPLPSP
ncbi:hypothetical protein AB0L41_45940 [Amycolatopsis mediterranei]|uniref:hypothetical protein n=1 Tax=Amycolatopsis mediterranei TaxID=33910 RepID=UPI00341DDD0D